jgi:uncharacterized protein YciI
VLWAILCIDKPGTAATRDRLRAIHREHLDKQGTGLFFSGPLLADEDENEQIGSLFVLKAGSREEARAFIDPEPFNQAGVFADIRIFRMRKGRFNPLLVDGV